MTIKIIPGDILPCETSHTIQGRLKNKHNVLVNVIQNKNSQITGLGYQETKNGYFYGGQAIRNFDGIDENKTMNFFEDLQKQAEQGINFFREFAKIILR